VDHGTIILQCATRRLDGALIDEKGKLFLEIYEVRECLGGARRIASRYFTVPSPFAWATAVPVTRRYPG